MRKAATKALYLFLCSILGMVLFAMLHRAIFVIYDLVLIFDYNTFSLGLSQANILAIDFITMLGALFLGGWYGILLGIDWYSMVYGPNAETKAGLFHGFVPHNWRKGVKKSSPTPKPILAPEPESSVTVKPASKPKRSTVKKSVPKKQEEKVPLVSTPEAWSFEDFLKATPAPKTRAVAAVKPKKVARKTTRKTAAKRTVKTAVTE